MSSGVLDEAAKVARDEILSLSYDSYLILVSVVIAFGMSTSVSRYFAASESISRESFIVSQLIEDVRILKKTLVSIADAGEGEAASSAADAFESAIIDYVLKTVCLEFPHIRSGNAKKVDLKSCAGSCGISIQDIEEPQTSAAFEGTIVAFENFTSSVNAILASKGDSNSINQQYYAVVSSVKDMNEARDKRLTLAASTISWPFWAVMIGLAVTAAAFPLFLVMRDSGVLTLYKIATSAILAIAFGLILWLTYEFSHPFKSFIHVREDVIWGRFLKRYAPNGNPIV
jgi:hypothetical protein